MTVPQTATAPAVWGGTWVAERLPARIVTRAAPVGVDVADLVGLALRRNPLRAHLLVSRVLGKHIPADPRLVCGAGLLLGELVRRVLAGEDPYAGLGGPANLLAAALAPGGVRAAHAAALPSAVAAAQPLDPAAYPAAVVVGYCETATSLGHAVADALRTAAYVHSTRRPVAGFAPVCGFEEEHSHATGHLLLPADPELLARPGPVVLVDDELSTGRTVGNTVAALQRLCPRPRYVAAALVDLRSPRDAAELAAAAEDLGTRIDVVALASGGVHLPPDAPERGRRLVAAATLPGAAAGSPGTAGRLPGTAEGLRGQATGRVREVAAGWPAGVPVTGRHGFAPADRERLEAAAAGVADRLAAALWPGPGPGPGRVLVLGTEELMYAPLRVAAALAERAPAAQVLFSSTTRSPVLAVDEPGYAVRTRLEFPTHDLTSDDPTSGDPTSGDLNSADADPGEVASGRRYAYNVAAPAGEPGFGAVVLVLDAAADTPALRAPGGLLDTLCAAAGEVLVCVLDERPALPAPLRGPAFGSYAPDEVAWLLQDLSGVALEAPVEEREEAVQNRGAHYAESLPEEYQPTAEYQALFRTALEDSAGRIARAVGTVTEAVLASRGRGAVLVSLARAGTPVGILMRRWAARAGLDLPHYSVSIVRGRGIDPVALRWLAAHHDPADVVFVDGWTGKGAIARELAAALADFHDARFNPELAVLADPGSAVPVAGTREDFLVPSACLNSTVSGLISRTVLRADLVGPADFHGAKFYSDLAGADVSAEFLDAVSACFACAAADVPTGAAAVTAATRPVTWAGWAAVERISDAYGIGDVNLVKPGVGETTRVLLRRVPWRVLARADAGAELDHIRLLAAQRGVPVEEVPAAEGLPFRCVGLIHPKYTRGATGSSGRAAVVPA